MVEERIERLDPRHIQLVIGLLARVGAHVEDTFTSNKISSAQTARDMCASKLVIPDERCQEAC